MSSIQTSLYPDEVLTNAKDVAAIFNKDAVIYTELALKDGWSASFALTKSDLKQFLCPKTTNKQIESSHKHVLDAGCGDGILAEQIEFNMDNVSLYGIDISTGMLSIAERRNKYKQLTLASITEEIPFEAEYFDVIIASGVLGYCENSFPIYEFLRVLKPGGQIMIHIRTHHFNDRGYPKAMIELAAQCKFVKDEIYIPFVNNPEFKHEYRYMVIEKY